MLLKSKYFVIIAPMRLNPVNPQVLAVNSTWNETSPLPDLSLDLVVVIHGFTGNVTSKSVTLIRDAVLFRHNANVLAVNWARLARGPWYDEAVEHTVNVGYALADLLADLESNGLDLDHVHIIGFSLGAHIAGFTGAQLNGRIGKISGLDPARPGFDNRNETGRLDPTDAKFVLGVHTGSGLLAMSDPIGHVDFYPNGGSKQPHCIKDDLPLVCNHFMSYTYYAESVYEPTAFPAHRCNSWADFDKQLCDANEVVFMGYDTPTDTRGLFYLRTNAEEPYGLGNVNPRPNGVSSEDAAVTIKHVPQEQNSGSAMPPLGGGGHNKDIYVVDNSVDTNISVQPHTDDDLAGQEKASSSGRSFLRSGGALSVFPVLLALYADVILRIFNRLLNSGH